MTDARKSIITMRVTPAQKKRIQGKAKKAGESVSTYLLRAVESAGTIPPREQKSGKGEKIVVCFRSGEKPQETREKAPERENCFVLIDKAKEWAE